PDGWIDDPPALDDLIVFRGESFRASGKQRCARCGGGNELAPVQHRTLPAWFAVCLAEMLDGSRQSVNRSSATRQPAPESAGICAARLSILKLIRNGIFCHSERSEESLL